jgi:rSAM/selenodomain-associated transferase 1
MFAKNPETEKTKTRLARKIGEFKARKIYKQLLNDNIKIHSKASYDFVVYVQGDLDYFSKVKTKKQLGADLGEKMMNAFKEQLEYYNKVAIVGSDLILESSLVEEAFEELENFDVVIGPSNDGGYYLLGMKKTNNIFKDISWSTSTVFKETIQKIKTIDLNYSILSKRRDIDTIEDLKHYKDMSSFDL